MASPDMRGARMLGPQQEEEPVFIVINEQGQEEEISQERAWEFSSDAMRYIASQEGET